MNAFNKKYYWIGLLAFLVAVIILFQANIVKEKKYQLHPTRIGRLEVMRESLVGKKLLNINAIIPTNKKSLDNGIGVAYYNSNDCPSCVVKLMEILSIIESKYSLIPTYAITNDPGSDFPLVKNNLDTPLFIDEEGEFQKWINYSYSPAIFYLDENYIIKEIYYATTPAYQEVVPGFFYI